MLIIFQALSVLMRVLACDRIARERRVADSVRLAETRPFYQLENALTSAAKVFKSEVTCPFIFLHVASKERQLTMFHVAKIYVHLARGGCKLIYDLTVTHYPQFRGNVTMADRLLRASITRDVAEETIEKIVLATAGDDVNESLPAFHHS